MQYHSPLKKCTYLHFLNGTNMFAALFRERERLSLFMSVPVPNGAHNETSLCKTHTLGFIP